MTTDILAYGEAMVEFNQRQHDARMYLQGFGGDTSNFCIAAARQGARSGYISALGNDHFGQKLRELWLAEQVDASHVASDAQAATGVYFVSHDQNGHHFDYLRAGSAASRYASAQLPLAAIAAAKVLHLSGISLAISASACDAGLAAMAHARKHGVRTSLDTNLRLKLWPLERAQEKMREAFALCDICLPSWDDISALTGLDDRDAIVDTLLSYGIGLVAFKLGAEGCYVATAGERRLVPAYGVEAVDATGAGDCFGGAFIARLTAGDDPFRAARYANVCAALSTTGYGAVAPIPRAAQVEEILGSS
ncbi:sugar kinase [Collimonas fungivorans]|uniref:2-dehydro-3-deoxygluconate kinase n=1 Tax=Collimonas fungivorans (strain Ter331) TaxID=1005048 RepID=G0AJH0_COLFT|nr:sugar kinase [Collimonas fungivorans]AEK61104.1 2-dehydro-3-deoxygluconate kinase [Collimonas fungivorans Ter331]